MRKPKSRFTAWLGLVHLLAVFLLSLLQVACSGTSWKEEALQPDGSVVIVTRTVDRGGRHEIGQEPPIKMQSLRFKLPANGQDIEWKTEVSQDIGMADFQPLSVHVVAKSAYIVTWPVGCLAYNKWGRPNPPYVAFKSTGSTWQQIPLKDIPAAIKAPNIIFGSPDTNAKKLGGGTIKLSGVREVNERLEQPEFKTILREKIDYDPACVPKVSNGKGLWLATEFFSREKNLEACEVACFVEKFDASNCPCKTIFQRK
jgi:hypothetical protein